MKKLCAPVEWENKTGPWVLKIRHEKVVFRVGSVSFFGHFAFAGNIELGQFKSERAAKRAVEKALGVVRR